MCECVNAICLPAFDLSQRHTCDTVVGPLDSVTNRGDTRGRHGSHQYCDTRAAAGEQPVVRGETFSGDSQRQTGTLKAQT